MSRALLTFQGHIYWLYDSCLRNEALAVLVSCSFFASFYQNDELTVRRLFYLNPLGYGYSAIFANEFSRLDFQCDQAYTIPRNIPQAGVTGFPDSGVSDNQLCSLPGSVPGQDVISGDAYMAAAFDYYSSNIWRNVSVSLRIDADTSSAF